MQIVFLPMIRGRGGGMVFDGGVREQA